MTNQTNNTNQKIFIAGKLTVESVKYKDESKGSFKVAKLSVPFHSSLEVKDNWVEEFETGTYEGQFWVSNIFIRSFPTKTGGIFSVLCAEVPEYHIEDADETEIEESALEIERVDPVEESAAKTTPEPSNDDEGDKDADTDVDKAIFDATGVKSMDELPNAVSLDMTLDRKVIRAFCDRINVKNGGDFKFDGSSKKWIRLSK